MNNQQNSLHGNAVVIQNMGILILGKPGIGKSQLCLELLERNHQLICDDVIILDKHSQQLMAKAHVVSAGLINIRSIGTIDVSAHFSAEQIIDHHPIHLAIRLEDEMAIHAKKLEILGCSIPQICIPKCQSRPLPLLVETLVRKHALENVGYSAEAKLQFRQHQALQVPLHEF